jgi:hypothetical protein
MLQIFDENSIPSMPSASTTQLNKLGKKEGLSSKSSAPTTRKALQSLSTSQINVRSTQLSVSQTGGKGLGGVDKSLVKKTKIEVTKDSQGGKSMKPKVLASAAAFEVS